MSIEIPLILVVDDNDMNRDMLSRRLQRHNCEVVLAESGSAALEIVRSRAFHLIMLDIMMPVMNGYQVLEQLKADPVLQHIPVIMISAVDDLDSVVKCIEMGADDYLFKPFNPVLLKARVTASLNRYQRAQSLSTEPVRRVLEHLRAEAGIMAVASPTEQQAALMRLNSHLDTLETLLTAG